MKKILNWKPTPNHYPSLHRCQWLWTSGVEIEGLLSLSCSLSLAIFLLLVIFLSLLVPISPCSFFPLPARFFHSMVIFLFPLVFSSPCSSYLQPILSFFCPCQELWFINLKNTNISLEILKFFVFFMRFIVWPGEVGTLCSCGEGVGLVISIMSSNHNQLPDKYWNLKLEIRMEIFYKYWKY